MEIFENLGLSLTSIVFHTINLVILIVALHFLLYKPVKKMIANHKAKLNDIFAHVKAQRRKIGKLELKLRFTGYDPDDLRFANAYANELKQAYGKVSDSDFIFDTAKKMYPYQRYPHGVYVLLIYK